MPTSDKKIEANRANAEKSTGPITREGKARSSRNAVRHGLTSKDLFIPPDQQEEFDDLAQELRIDLAPHGVAETLAFQQVLSAVWRLIRCDRAEAALAARTTELDPLLDPKLQPTLRTIAAARSQAARLQKQATAELRTLQTERHYRLAVSPENEATASGLANTQAINARLLRQPPAHTFTRAEADAFLRDMIEEPPSAHLSAATTYAEGRSLHV